MKGTIKGPGNVALAGITVCLDDLSGPFYCVASGTTAANGSYAIDAPAGSYNVREYDPDGVYVPGYWSAGGFQLLQTNAGVVIVTTSDVTGINVTVPLFPYIRGVLHDVHGNPIAGLGVDGPSWSDVTDGTGAFDIKVWPESDNKLWARTTPEFKGGYYVAPDGSTRDEAQATAIHVASSDVTGIQFLNPHWPKISGHVTDVDGAPVAGLQLDFFKSYDQGTTVTDADGAYAFYAYNGDGWYVQMGGGGGGEFVSQTVFVGGTVDATVDLVAHRLPVVSGQLTGPHGEPISGINVTVQQQAWPYNTSAGVSDSTGSFSIRFIFGDAETDVRVTFADPTTTYVNGGLDNGGFTYVTTATFAIGPDDVLDASVVMPAYVHLTGHLKLADGGPATGQVTAWSEGWNPNTDAALDGSFSVKVRPGSYRLQVPGGFYGTQGFAYLRAAATPFAVGNDDLDVDVVLPAGHQLKGRVTSGTTPLGGIEVDIYLNGTPFTSGTTASDGSWAIGVPPGAYQVGFYDPSKARAHGWYGPSGYTSDPGVARIVAVGIGDATGINVSLPTTRRVAGKVVDAALGGAVSYAYVEAWVNGVFYSAQYATSTGAYNLPVAPGNVTLWVYDGYRLIFAPGWRTATGLTANFASAAVTTVGTTNISGLTIKAPEGVLLRINGAGNTTTEAIAYGATASFDIVESDGTHYMPLLKGTYAFWIDFPDSPYSVSQDGWWTSSGMTADYALATKKSVTADATISLVAPAGATLAGLVRDTGGGFVGDVEVQLYANGSFYESTISTDGSYSLETLPGTYRIAFVDLFGEYRTGWLGPGGYVADFASAQLVTVASGSYQSVPDVELPLGAPPSAPTNVQAIPYHASAQVSFTPVTTTTARPILHYAVTASPGGRQCIAVTEPRCTVTGLTDGVSYTFTVTASTIVGSGSVSAASAPVLPYPVPDAPSSVSAAPTAHDVAVSWTAPAANGSAITSYLVTATPGGATCAPIPATDTGCTLPGLADGIYDLTVTATNAVGTGPAAAVGVMVDTVAPVVTAPVTTLRSGLSMSGSSIPVTVAWTAGDSLAGLADTTLERSLGAGAFVDQALPAATSTSTATTLASSASAYRFRDRATDGRGNVSSWSTGPWTFLTLKQETGTGIVYAGTWATSYTSTALGGKLRSTTSRSASVSYTFTGRGVSFVSRKGTTNGKVSLYLDGAYIGTVDLYSSSTALRWVAWAKTNTGSAKHVLKIVNQATSGRPRFYIDAFATIR